MLLILTITITIDYLVIMHLIPHSRTRSCFSLVSFTHRSFNCNGHSILSPSSHSSLGIQPSLPHMEDADYQQQVIPAIAIIPHSISDSSEMKT